MKCSGPHNYPECEEGLVRSGEQTNHRLDQLQHGLTESSVICFTALVNSEPRKYLQFPRGGPGLIKRRVSERAGLWMFAWCWTGVITTTNRSTSA